MSRHVVMILTHFDLLIYWIKTFCLERLISFQTLHKVSKHWKCHRQYGVNIGGLSALIYVMSRTDSVDFSTKKDRLAQNQSNEI